MLASPISERAYCECYHGESCNVVLASPIPIHNKLTVNVIMKNLAVPY
jgi:hypothetical protein